MADKKSNPQQIAQSVYDPSNNSINVSDISNLVPTKFNEMLLSYVGQNSDPIAVTYRLNGSTVAVLNFEYDINGRVTRVYRQS